MARIARPKKSATAAPKATKSSGKAAASKANPKPAKDEEKKPKKGAAEPAPEPEAQEEQEQAQENNKERAITKPERGGAIAASVPSFIPVGEDYQNRGKENIETEDMGVPRLALLQGLSPEVTDVSRGPDEGYKPGLYYFPPADLILGNEFSFVVLGYQKDYIWWRDRKDGGGMVARATPQQIADGDYPEGTSKADFAFTKDGPPKVTTHMNFLVVEYDPVGDQLDPNEIGPFIFSCQKTTMAPGKNLCRMLKSKPTASYAAVFTTRSKQVTNKKGTFFIHDISAEVELDDEENVVEGSGWLRSEQSWKSIDELFTRLSGKEIKARYDREDDEEHADTVAGATGAVGSEDY